MSYAKGFVEVVKDIDPAKFEQLRDRLQGKATQINVGFAAGIPHKNDDGSEAPYTVAQIAAVHEFGAPNAGIPERSFLRAGIARNVSKYKALNRKSILGILKGTTTMEQGLGLLGELAKGDVQSEIRNGDHAPLKESTINRKGSSQPLIDTGQMRQAVDWEYSDD